MYLITERNNPPVGEPQFRIELMPDNFFFANKKKLRRWKGKGMNEVGLVRASPDPDCNSNHHGGSASYLSNTSSQDIDFVQDNSDYQWFLDYGYRDGSSNHHTSLLSLPETYEGGQNYYDALAKNMDANLAEADMESFRTEDIHALLTNLPPMCTDHLSQSAHRHGESFAEVSGSMMGKFDWTSPHSSSQEEDCSANSNSMSICKSELLFSPVKETPMPGAHFSVDSLDCDIQDLMLTCQANKDNYTIAFEGSMTMYSEDNISDYHDKCKTSIQTTSDRVNLDTTAQAKPKSLKILDNSQSMTQSDSSSFTTWSKLQKRSSNDPLRNPSGNNNNSEDESSRLGLSEMSALKSQSMPNLHKQKLKRNLINNSEYLKNSNSNSSSDTTVKRRPVKVFDIHHQIHSSSGSGSGSDMATSVDASSCENGGAGNGKQPFSLVKLFMKQKSCSTEGMSTTADQLSSSDNWPGSQSGDSNNSSNINHAEKHLDSSNEQKPNEDSRIYDLAAEEPPVYDSVDRVLQSSVPKSEASFNNNDSFGAQTRPKMPLPKSLIDLKHSHMERSIQTSQFSEITNLKNISNKARKEPIRILEPSFLNKLKKEGEIQKPVYVLYPNYCLPDLEFLNEKNDISNMLFVPQRAPHVPVNIRQRPFSFNDVEMLRRKGFGHVRDWDSLNVLLPQEYRKILADVPEISNHIKTSCLRERPSFMRAKRRPQSFEGANLTNTSSSSSTATQPSSGYRGSSTILTDSQNSPAQQSNLNPLFVYRYDSVTSSEASLVNSDKQRGTSITTTPPCPLRYASLPQENVPPRPPLPRGILRKADINKRYSVYETSEEETQEDPSYKRRSMPETYYSARHKRFSETEDEGVDAGTSSSSLDEPNKPPTDYVLPNMSVDELIQLEEFLKLSGFSTSDEHQQQQQNEESLTHLRSYVSKFLSLKINQEGSEHFGGKKTVSFAEKIRLGAKHAMPPNNSPNVSALLQQKNFHPKSLADLPISEENEGNSPNFTTPQSTPIHLCKNPSDNYLQKRSLINGVLEAVDQIMHHFSTASNQTELNSLGDSSLNPACAKLTLTTLCPALYAVLSDGLKPCLETSFGAINNSVWQVVEASAQQGPLTKALNDLVMKINTEDVISEGLIKFNAFIFGLLNVRSLDAWTSYLRTRESVLKKHYTADSLLVLSHTGGSNIRGMLDAMVAALQPLAFLPFQMDLLFEYKLLHLSFKRMDSYHQVVSPTHKHAPSPNYKQFLSAKYGLSSHSNSESEEHSAATIVKRRILDEPTTALPDLLNSSEAVHRIKRTDRERPRSCLEPKFQLGEDVNDCAKKRWSQIALNSKLYQVYDRLAKEEDDYQDSLENAGQQKLDETRSSKERIPQLRDDQEPESLDSNFSDEKPLNGRRFKKLQQRWEMLSGKESQEATSPPLSPTHTPTNKSKIPRPIISPVKPSGIPVLVSPTAVTAKQQPHQSAKKVTTPPGSSKGVVAAIKGVNTVKSSPVKRPVSARTSRVDQLEKPETPKHAQRPSSLPYKPACQSSKTSKIVPPRRAVSSSLNRRPLSTSNATPKVVRTIGHRLPSDNGHLSYNDGERLRVVLEVDDKWLLCCRGTQKGLVPKSSVMTDTGPF